MLHIYIRELFILQADTDIQQSINSTTVACMYSHCYKQTLAPGLPAAPSSPSDPGSP